MPEDKDHSAAVEARGDVCGCKCRHARLIQVRIGFIVCKTGREKLCEECVEPDFTCHSEECVA